MNVRLSIAPRLVKDREYNAVASSDNEIISLLAAYRPEDLISLQKKYPKDAARLSPRGLVLGEGENNEAMRAAAIKLLDSTSDIATETCKATDRRLFLARRLDFCGALLTLASSAGIVTALMGFIKGDTALPLAFFSFVGGAIPLLTNWFRSSASGISLTDAVTGLRDAVWEAQALRGRIERDTGPADLVTEVNAVARKLAQQLNALGNPAAVKPI